MAGDNFFSSHIAFGFVSKAFLDPFIENIDKKYKIDNMISLNDIWGENYYNQDWSVNPKCKLFAGWSNERINEYLQNNQ